MTAAERNIATWDVAEVYRRLRHGPSFQMLDVRAAPDFAAWRIEGRAPIPTLNLPYFEFLDLDQDEDVVGAVVHSAPTAILPHLQPDLPVLVICPHGNTSALVAEGLRRLGVPAVNLAGGMAAWGDHYHAATIVDTGALRIVQISRPARGCLSHMVASDGKAAVIDPLRHVQVYRDFAAAHGWDITHVLDTHMHADHLSGGVVLAQQAQVDYHLHPYDAIHPMDMLPARLDYRFLHEGQCLRVGHAVLRALHIPGHTLGEVAFLVNDEWLIAGDSLFIASVARPDLGGHPEKWAPLFHHSLQRLLTLPDGTVVLPAHFSTLQEGDTAGRFMARLDELRMHNEGLAMAARPEAEFTRYVLGSLPEFHDKYVEIKRVNTGLAEADERRASELELGKNVCALSRYPQ